MLGLPHKGVIPSAGDQHGNIRVWDLTANACSCELVPEVGTAVRSLTVAMDGSLVVAANNQGALIVQLSQLVPLGQRVCYTRTMRDLRRDSCPGAHPAKIKLSSYCGQVRLHGSAGTCYVWRMMRGASLTTHFEPLHKLRAHPGTSLRGMLSKTRTGQRATVPGVCCDLVIVNLSDVKHSKLTALEAIA